MVCDCRYYHRKVVSFSISGSGDKQLQLEDGRSFSARHCCNPADHPKHWYIYLLKCSDGSLYCGATNDLERREEQHNKGKGGSYTRSHLPVKMVYSERMEDKSSALKREYQIKQLSREEKLHLIKNQGK